MSASSIELSDGLINWLDGFSRSAAVDMGEGSDDAECVAEICISCLSSYEPELAIELTDAIKKYGYHTVLCEAAKHV